MSERSDEVFVPPERPIPREAYPFYTIMRMDACEAAANLYEGWKRPVRHNLKIERLALWHTVRLDEQCLRAWSDPRLNPRLVFEPSNASPAARYDIDNALMAIPHLVPFTDIERERLCVPTDKTFEQWGEDMAEREPRIVAEWHEWLWSENPRDRDPQADRGDASTLGVATNRLSRALYDVLWAKEVS